MTKQELEERANKNLSSNINYINNHTISKFKGAHNVNTIIFSIQQMQKNNFKVNAENKKLLSKIL